MTPSAYLTWEADQERRYEYFDGQVFAMVGGSLAHGRIGLNLCFLLKPQAQSRGCITFNSDCKVGLSEHGPFTYPDVSVSCDERDRTARQFIQFPCLIAEVLSPGTEAYDRGGKFALYRQIKTLQEYLLVGSEAKTVELFRRNPRDSWEYIPYAEGARIELGCLGMSLTMGQIYEGVVLEPSARGLT